MIVVDSSALTATLENEPDATIYATANQRAGRLLVSAVTVRQTGTVLRAGCGITAV